MSDLEATSSRGQSAAPITAVASGKLRAVSGTLAPFAQSAGLIDAFAEVFASMAESSVEPIDAPDAIADKEVEQSLSDRTSTRSAEDESPDAEADQVTLETQIAVESFVPEIDEFATPVDVHALDQNALDDEPDDLVAEDEDPAAANVTVVAVAVSQTGSEVNEVETPEVLTAPQAHPEDAARERRDRREATAVESSENNNNNGPWRENPGVDEEQVRSQGDPIDTSGEQALEQSDDGEIAQSPPRLRGRHRASGESTEAGPKLSTKSVQNRPPQSADSINHAPVGDTLASPVGTTPSASPRASMSNVESPIVNVQGIASSVARSGAASGQQTGTRGSTQAIDSLAPARDVARDKPSTRSTKSTTAETVSRVKLIQRVSKAFQHLGPEGGVVRLRLAPAEMGSVRVEMQIRQRTVQARVVAETEAASTALREHLPDLRARLESLGMQVEKIEIETETADLQQGSHFDAQSQQQQQSRGERDSGFRFSRSESRRSESVSPPVSRSTLASPMVAATGGVDIRL